MTSRNGVFAPYSRFTIWRNFAADADLFFLISAMACFCFFVWSSGESSRRFSIRRRTILLLPGEKAGMRAGVGLTCSHKLAAFIRSDLREKFRRRFARRRAQFFERTTLHLGDGFGNFLHISRFAAFAA